MKRKIFKRISLGASGGFTLVELIVVIAILAILAGVALPAYSGYVKKANMGVDEALAGEVKHALTLAHYAGTLEPGSTVIVYYGNTPVDVEGNGADAAMAAVFGAGYENALHLKYDGWDADLGVIADGDAMENVDKSMFTGQNLGYMLDDVQLVVGLLGTAITNEGLEITNTDLEAYIVAKGLDATDANVVSNAAVMYVADKISAKVKETTEEGKPSNKDAIINSWLEMDMEDDRGNLQNPSKWLTTNTFYDALGKYNVSGGRYESSLQASAAGYARAEAIANFIDGELAAKDLTSDYAGSLRAASAGMDPDAMIEGGFAQIDDAAMDVIFNNSTDPTKVATVNAYLKYFGKKIEQGAIVDDPNAGETQASKDAKAFLSYMDGIVAASDSLIQDTDLKVDNYYTDGNILSYVTSYLDIGEALKAAGYTGGGAFAFVYTGVGADPVKCAPLDY